MRRFGSGFALASFALLAALLLTTGGSSQDKPAKTEDDGKWTDADGAPTYNITR